MTDAAAAAAAFDGALSLAGVALALWLQPWRGRTLADLPRPWLLLTAALPVLWTVDHFSGVPVAQPLSGAALLVLFAGWPLAVLALLPAAASVWWSTPLQGATTAAPALFEALHRLAWLGVMPATLTLALGYALRRWLPRHLFIYILGRGFFGVLLALLLSGAADVALHPLAPGLAAGDLLAAHVLNAFAEAFLTGMLVAVGVAFRPHWLATYSDRLYLPPRPL
jgi:uncharacterized membrane protein